MGDGEQRGDDLQPTSRGVFNATVERFLRTPFVKKDRINDLLKSFEKLKTSLERR